ncbi:MAG: heme exporter protein CcmB [Gammaproteobacteria bacterium TMED119]|nr:MAG: heme exporter protein CcmB [Gammaproteobacteria bacterium TMED119]RCL46126.1 MAG: heme exporter protein CcmB [Candidatus Thioglobus sp.]|tara:strand:- start:1715 stop:2380 length:666 start_codon:yes stop_codon:yes gene_type:complete
MNIFLAVLQRDLKLALRRRREVANPLVFFIIVVSLFPLGVSPDRELLSEIAPGVIWVTALLASLMSMDAIFRSDYDDGSLEQLLLLPGSKVLLVLAKVTAHWISIGLPLIIIAPVMALLLYFPAHAIVSLMVTLLISTPILSLLGAVGVALTLSLRTGGILSSLLILPFYIPVLIFSTMAISAATSNLPVMGYYALLGAFLIMSLILVPFAVVAALKVSHN